jgi:hypothetical protein
MFNSLLDVEKLLSNESCPTIHHNDTVQKKTSTTDLAKSNWDVRVMAGVRWRDKAHLLYC